MIRFALNELTGRNGHHEFEELARHLARARIVTNVVPATGPVGAGGDQGRDLETFRTYLASELGAHGAFLARSSEDTIVFACTLQQDGLTTKIRADVDKIMGSGSKVDHIVAVVGGELPVGPRHQLQTDVQEAHGVTLDVLDSRAVAQELAQSDTFWIAARYLSLPAELAPPAREDGSPEWYGELRDAWREREPVNTLADLLAIKSGLRRATFHLPERPDLPFWLGHMRLFLGDEFDDDLHWRARYEVAVATLRGTGDLTPADALAAEFVEHSCEADDPFELEDGSVLLMYCLGAFMRGKTTLTAECLAEWNDRLRHRVSGLLDTGPTPNRRAVLLQILGHLNMQPDAFRIEVTDEPVPDVAHLVDEEGDLNLEMDDVGVSAEDVMVDVDAGMSLWLELTSLFEQAALFPVERLADLLSILTPLIVDHPLYRALADAVDEQVEKTAGRAAAAARCRDRAIALRRSDKYVAALREFHRAKVGWWSGDSIRGSLLAMFLIADCYEQLGFLHAAKQSVLLAARVAANSNDDDLQDLFAQGVSIAAHMDYGLGSWFSSAAAAEAGLILHSNLVSTLDLDDHRVERMMYELMWIYLASRDLIPILATKVKHLLELAGMWNEVQGIIAETAPREADEWIDVVRAQLFGEWMGDVKDEWRISFAGLGTTWTIIGANEPITARAIQRLAAAAEVLLAELASDDLALLNTDIHVSVALGATSGERAHPLPSNEGRHWKVLLTPWSDSVSGSEEPVRVELLAVLSSILAEASVLPVEQFMARIEEAFKRGLSHKIGFGPLFDELLYWIAHDGYEGLRPGIALPIAVQEARYIPATAPELAWQDGPGPTYDQGEAMDAIRRRYERVAELFPFTLARLMASPEFATTVDELRRRGWRDWHILNCIASAATNHRMQMLGLDRYVSDPGPKGDEARMTFQMLAFEPETAMLKGVPLAVFSLENLEYNRVFGLVVFLKGVGLDVHQGTPDLPAIEHFLAERYAYWSDDIPHDDPFV